MLRPLEIDGSGRPPDDAVLILGKVGAAVSAGSSKKVYIGVAHSIAGGKPHSVFKRNLDEVVGSVVAGRFTIHFVEEVEGILLFKNKGVIRLLARECGGDKTSGIIVDKELLCGTGDTLVFH